jgi:hypothetical protein
MICPCCGKHKRPKNLDGLGSALKPAMELIAVARRPLIGTLAENVLAHGTGGLNVDGCRVSTSDTLSIGSGRINLAGGRGGVTGGEQHTAGRWPANLVHDGSEEVVAAFPAEAGGAPGTRNNAGHKSVAKGHETPNQTSGFGDSGSAARFFYAAKADSDDRLGSKHPTIKPVDLMQWLVRLITPPGGTVLDPFSGTGTTGEAAIREGMCAVLIEREPEYLADIARRMNLALGGPDERRHATLKAKGMVLDAGPLFAGAAE